MNFIMKKQLEMKKGSKKGFTLVEVIVVIVIIAILAAIAVPALTGYIEKASKRGAVIEARNVGQALQTMANDKPTGASLPATGGTGGSSYTTSQTYANEIAALVGIPATSVSDTNLTDIGYTAGVLQKFVFKSSTGKTVTYTLAKGYEVA